MTDIKPIETQYKGYRFRSRLEARWAVFFDALGIEWQYEPEGYDLGEAGWYLPDFWLPIQHHLYSPAGYWVEIKGEISQGDLSTAWHKLHALTKATMHNGHLLCGDIGNGRIYKVDKSEPLTVEESLKERRRRMDAELQRQLELAEEFLIGEALHAERERIKKWHAYFESPSWELYLFASHMMSTQGKEGGEEAIARAITAARSARFEHGETPSTGHRL